MASSGEFYIILAGSAASCRKYVVTWTSTQNIIENTTLITCTHKLVCDYSWSTYLNSISVVCNISGVSSSLSGINVSVGTSGGTVTLGTTTHIISHNADGTKSVNFSSTFNPNGSSGFTGTATASTSLPTIDRSEPSVSVNISNITSSGFKISATSSVLVDKWEYSLSGGSSYTQFSTTEGTTASVTVPNLSANTTYSVKVRARKKTNQVSGVSETKSVKTLGGSVLNSATTVTADDANVTVGVNVTVYNASYYHKLTIKNGNTTVLTINAGQFTAGTNFRNIVLSSSQRTTLLNAMSTIKSFNATLSLTTYTTSAYSTQVGNASDKPCVIETTKANSAPTFTNFSYTDTRGIIGGLTGSSANNNILVQTYSLLRVTATAGTAKNGASIVSYSASIGDASKTSTSTQIDVGAVESTGDIQLTVTCTDSRGYATSVTKTVKVLKYASPKCTNFTLRRKNEIEDTVQLSFNGSFSSLKPVSAEVNALKVVGFEYKQTSASNWSSTFSIKDSVSVSGNTFSFSTTQLMISSTQALSLDENTSYDFKLIIHDNLETYTVCEIEAVIAQGTPLVSLRKRDSSYNFPRVGINNPSPQEALDVSGNIKASGTLKALGLDLTEAVVIYYGTCATADSAQAKVVTLKYSAGFRLVEGVSIRIKFSNGQTYNGQPTLNVNSTGAKNIVSRGTTAGNRYMWLAGEIIDFVYDGTNWCAVDSGIASTTYYGVTKLSSSVTSTSTSTAATPSAVKKVNDRITFGSTPCDDGITPLNDGVFYAKYATSQSSSKGLYVGVSENFTVENMLAAVDARKAQSGSIQWHYTANQSELCPDGYNDYTFKPYDSNNTGASEMTTGLFNNGSTEIKPTIDNTHRYYFSAWLHQDNVNGSFDFYWPVAEPSVISGAVAIAGQWTKVSAVFDRSSFASGAQKCRIDYNAPTREPLRISGLVLVDLTATFGSGREPDKTWCDANIKFSRETYSVERGYARLVAT